MPRILSPLPSLQLDPRNTAALLNAIQTRVYLESGGVLNDFSSASPLAALTEGQAFAASELLYYLNSLPEAFAVQWMRLLGVQRVIGATAYVDMVFSKVPGYQRPVMIPRNTELFTPRGLKFILKEDVTIGALDTSATGVAVSEKWGTVYNVPPLSVTTVGTAIIGLDSVYNITEGRGGEDTETIAEMKSRAFSVLRRRSLLTQEDFANEIFAILPELDFVWMVPSNILENDEEARANQLLYVIGYDTTTSLSPEVKSSILSTLKNKTPLGVNLSLTEPVYTPLYISLTVRHDSRTVSSDSVAERIKQTLQSVFTPSSILLGETIPAETGLEQIFYLAGIENINRYEISTLIPKGDDPHLHIGECDSDFESYTDIETGLCVRKKGVTLNLEENNSYQAEVLETFKLYQLEVVTVDPAGNAFVYNYDNLYELS